MGFATRPAPRIRIDRRIQFVFTILQRNPNRIAIGRFGCPQLICHELAHIYHYERSGFAAVCGLLARPLGGAYGVVAPEAVAALYGRPDIHRQEIW